MQSTIVRLLRESGKKRLFMVPFLFTFANACFGLLSILYALDDYYTIAAYCIIGASIVDMLDGRLARALGSTTSLGMELDSLCDAVSFCLAPAILLYEIYFYYDGLLALITVGIYLCAGLFRLAKFNITCDQQKNAFIGMPTPIGALLVALSVIHYQWLMASSWGLLFSSSYLLMALGLFISFLMISKVRFANFKCGFHDPLSYLSIITILGASAVSLVHGFPVFLTVLFAYSLISIIFYYLAHAYRYLRRVFC